MSLKSVDIKRLGDELFRAQRDARMIAPLTDTYTSMTIADGYKIQQQLIARRLDAGEHIIGKKVGVTSQAVMAMLKVDQPDFGQLTDRMVVNQGDSIDISTMIQPKVEGEIAFVLKHDLSGPGVTVPDVLRATEGIMACLEIVDSRIQDWKIKIQDTVADNASCGLFAISDRMVSPSDLDFYTMGMVLEKNGRIVGMGTGAATMGSPVVAIAWLANTLGELGISLKAGEIILSGALSGMVPVGSGDVVQMSLANVGRCSVLFN